MGELRRSGGHVRSRSDPPEPTTETVALWGPFLTAYGDVVNHVGAIPLAASRTAAKKQRLLDTGAAQVIVTDDEDVVTRTREITAGHGADFVFDAVAGPGVRALSDATARGGTLVVPETPFPLWTLPTMRMFNAFELTMNPQRLDRTFDFFDIAESHRYLEANGQFGKVVVTVGG
ncbi:zinc-binding dehydrogenase [Amycolatopsis sp. NBC_00438]|uniref:zinc-binding dehydrogenase n=1 Tax=Amycolatopsis sp. NBC_00438 TaxID=2903558 RepID=UPI002E22F611